MLSQTDANAPAAQTQQIAAKKPKQKTRAAKISAAKETIAEVLADGFREFTIENAKKIFDFLQAEGSSNFLTLRALLPHDSPLVAFESATDYLEERKLITFNATEQHYSLKPGAEWNAAPLINYSNRIPDSTAVIFNLDGRETEGYVFDITKDGKSYLVKYAEGERVLNIYLAPGEITVKEEYRRIPLEALILSRSEPQAKRRQNINDAKLAELIESVRHSGVIEPIVVRRTTAPAMTHSSEVLQNFYEIVCGERRFLAAKAAGLTTIKAIIEALSDAQALQMQLAENLHRKDVEPLDEAVWYEYMLKEHGTIHQLATQIGKSEKHVAGRLKLNCLIDEAKTKLANDELPVTLALEVAKFAADVQPEVLKYCFDYDVRPRSLKSLRENVTTHILLDLKSAAFSMTDTNLRPDGLACVDCPQRTGARNLLFEEYFDKKKDRCLNKTCFAGKTETRMLLLRDEMTTQAIADGKPMDYQVPLYVFQIRDTPAVIEKFGGVVVNDKNCSYDVKCASAEPAIYATYQTGKTLSICRDLDCGQHGGILKSRTNTETDEERREREQAEKRKRASEAFEIKVAESVRLEIFKQAAENFDEKARLFNFTDDAARQEKWIAEIVARLWFLENRSSSSTGEKIRQILDLGKADLPTGYGDYDTFRAAVVKLSQARQSKLLFLLMVGFRGVVDYSPRLQDQTPVIALADEFGVNAKLLDAQMRVKEANKKQRPAALEYLKKIEAGEDAEKPDFFPVEGDEAA